MDKKKIFYYLTTYLALRIFSYFFQPITPLHGQSIVNTAFSITILIITLYWLFKKDERGFLLIIGEIILGGAGGFFAINGISLRTCLLVGGSMIYFYQFLKEKKYQHHVFLEKENIIIVSLLFWAGITAINGWFSGHALSLIIADFIPYCFFLYYWPLKECWKKENFKSNIKPMLGAAIIGNFLLIFFTFLSFTTRWFILQNNYYHWFRDVALGKITALPFDFYRLVLNEHLLLVPVLLWVSWKLMKKTNKKIYPFLLIFLLAILSFNITRIYLLAWVIGLLILFSRKNWRYWLAVSTLSIVGFIIIFTSGHLAASRGKSLGWELLGLKIQSIANPQIEDSSLSRMLLLPKILEKIKTSPFLGTGLGDTVTVYSPIFKKTITTPFFDWGYLEIGAELGLIGLCFWLLLIFYIIKIILKKFKNPTTVEFARLDLAILLSLLIVNITSPAVFHVLGVLLFLTLLNNQKSMLS